MKKISLLICVLIVITSVFSGCGSDGKSSGATPDQAVTTAAKSTPDQTSDSAAGEDASWFDDAVFVGDSVTNMLNIYCMNDPEALGKAQFVCAPSLGFTNAQWALDDENNVHPSYKGKTVLAERAAELTGANKVLIMLGMNDIGKIVFSTVPNNAMEPGKPYLFEAKSNAMKFYYTAETPAVEPDNSGAMKGSFTSYTLYDLDNVYYFAGHALWSCDDLTELNVIANRAYVKLDEVVEISPAPVPGRRFVYMDVHGPNTTTGVDELNASETPVKVIIDGKLFILRGEKMYDVTGSLVK